MSDYVQRMTREGRPSRAAYWKGRKVGEGEWVSAGQGSGDGIIGCWGRKEMSGMRM